MSSDTFDDGSIGPGIDPADVRIPPHVGAGLARLFDRDERLDTAAEWIEAVRDAFGDVTDGEPSEEDLCHDPEGRHAVEIDGERRSFVCVLDPLIVPFLRESPGVVRSRTAVDGEQVTVDVGPDAASATPSGAVVSLGVARDVDPAEPLDAERIYGTLCPYVQTFATPAEYERWAEDVDAATTSLPVDHGVALARALADELFA